MYGNLNLSYRNFYVWISIFFHTRNFEMDSEGYSIFTTHVVRRRAISHGILLSQNKTEMHSTNSLYICWHRSAAIRQVGTYEEDLIKATPPCQFVLYDMSSAKVTQIYQ